MKKHEIKKIEEVQDTLFKVMAALDECETDHTPLCVADAMGMRVELIEAEGILQKLRDEV